MRDYTYHPDPDPSMAPEPEFTTVKPEGSAIAVLHCLAMARDAIARSPLKSEWTRDAFGWLDGAVAILTRRGDA